MGVRERKEREKGQLKELILNTAHKMFLKEGYDNTSIRKIAQAIEYSPATLYLYFKDKHELFYIIQQRAFESFFKKLSEFSFIKDPIGRLRSIAISYLEFAINEPKLYDLMFIMRPPMQTKEAVIWEPGLECQQMFREHIDACNEKNLLKKMNPSEATMLFWSFLHGYASLLVRNRVTLNGSKSEQLEQVKSTANTMIETMKLNYF